MNLDKAKLLEWAKVQEKVYYEKYELSGNRHALGASIGFDDVIDAIETGEFDSKEEAPTQWAYDQACKAIEKHRERADKAKSVIVELFTVMASAAVTIRDNPEQTQTMIEFLFEAIERNDVPKGENILIGG